MHVYVRICIYVYVYEYICMYMYVYVCICMYVCMYVYESTHILRTRSEELVFDADIEADGGANAINHCQIVWQIQETTTL